MCIKKEGAKTLKRKRMERKRCKVVMLPTDTPSNILVMGHGKIGYDPSICKHYDGQHLYIVSDDEIKEGDWIYYIESDNSKDWYVCKADSGVKWKSFGKRIIATTDGSLKLPHPSEAFIKKYCEKGGIDEVDVEYYPKGCSYGNIILDDLNGDGSYYGSGARYEVEISKSRAELESLGAVFHENLLKVDSHNTITIHPIKDSWTREEVEKLLKDVSACSALDDLFDVDTWIKQNL